MILYVHKIYVKIIMNFLKNFKVLNVLIIVINIMELIIVIFQQQKDVLIIVHK